MKKIDYPYIPAGHHFEYVVHDHPWMQQARQLVHHSGCCKQPVVAILVKNDQLIGSGANGFSRGHNPQDSCKRVELGCKTGEGYEHCPSCIPEGHAEPMAIADALRQGKDPRGCDLYLYGHWWVCQKCWQLLIDKEVVRIYVVEDAHLRWS